MNMQCPTCRRGYYSAAAGPLVRAGAALCDCGAELELVPLQARADVPSLEPVRSPACALPRSGGRD